MIICKLSHICTIHVSPVSKNITNGWCVCHKRHKMRFSVSPRLFDGLGNPSSFSISLPPSRSAVSVLRTGSVKVQGFSKHI